MPSNESASEVSSSYVSNNIFIIIEYIAQHIFSYVGQVYIIAFK